MKLWNRRGKDLLVASVIVMFAVLQAGCQVSTRWSIGKEPSADGSRCVGSGNTCKIAVIDVNDKDETGSMPSGS